MNGNNMIWPAELNLVRHGQSNYNILKALKAADPDYQVFKRLYNRWDARCEKGDWMREPPKSELVELAIQMRKKYSLGCSDPETPLTEMGIWQAQQTGKALAEFIEIPDVIFVSPYKRTWQTFENVKMFCPQFHGVKIREEDRIREQEHGLCALYNDWRIYHVFHPEQRAMFRLAGKYDYCFPGGENIARARDRVRRWFDKLIRDYPGKRVWGFTHHLTKLTIMGLLKHWSQEQFLWWDTHRVPPNLSVTTFRGTNTGKIEIELPEYGKIYYDQSKYAPA
ncbi:histidine phosphatase family protein [bacterium]|nr:MAG: histidine phosphatase family protein [bacterium]